MYIYFQIDTTGIKDNLILEIYIFSSAFYTYIGLADVFIT